jgi:histone deacetylase complex subunit SAP18
VKDFATRGKEPKDEVQIYTWRDTTLRELTDLTEDFLDVAIYKQIINVCGVI